jgi:hypothetical protein
LLNKETIDENSIRSLENTYPFAAGLLFGAVNGPGSKVVLTKGFLK